MIDLKTKQAFWAEQLPMFKEKYWIPGHLEVLEFDMLGGCFDIAEGVKTDLSEEDLFDIYHRVNSGWAMWKKAVNFMQEKARAQALPVNILNEIQSWIAIESIQAMELDGEQFVVGANELSNFINQLDQVPILPTWISVEDDEPPIDKMVLICWTDSPEIDPEIDYLTNDEDLNHIWANYDNDPPSHWMHFHKVPSKTGAEE